MKRVITIILVLAIFIVGLAFALPPNDFEPWRMYAVYEIGYDAGKDILDGDYGDVSLFQVCVELSDHSSWKSMGWDNRTIRQAEKLFFYGCINANGEKITKEEFMKNIVQEMMEKNKKGESERNPLEGK